MSRSFRPKALWRLIDQLLAEGSPVEIDGLGEFKRDEASRIVFQSNDRPRVFVAYAEEDRSQVRQIYRALQKSGFEPWMDCEKLYPGQNWPRAIERAIDISEFFIGCFSTHSVAKRGHFQCELQYALNVALRVPEEEIFFIPVRLDPCKVPANIQKKTQYVDLFPDSAHGIAELVRAMRFQTEQRCKNRRD